MSVRMRRVAITAGISLGSILALLYLLPLLFADRIEQSIKTWINQTVESQVDFKKVQIGFFSHFPRLTLTLKDFSLTGAVPFEKDTLMAGKSLSFGINLASIFQDDLEVDQFFIERAQVKVLVDKDGRANYAIYKGKKVTDTTAVKTSGGTSLQIQGIYFSDCSLYYEDASIPLLIESNQFSYEGRGMLDQEEFDLTSSLHAKSMSVEYNGTRYLDQRSVDAELITGVNTYSLALRFQKNDILINQLPVDFSGTLFFVRDGYAIDLSLVSGSTDFKHIFSVLPPGYDSWFKDTRITGKSKVTLDLKGAYRAGTGEAPDMHISCLINDGSIQHKSAPKPLRNVQMKTELYLPRLDPDSMLVKIDRLFFTLDGDSSQIKGQVLGFENPIIQADIKSTMELQLLDQALGLNDVDIAGKLAVQANIDGQLKRGQNPSNFRPDTILLSVPSYQLNARLEKGKIKFQQLPLAVAEISASIESNLKGSNWQDIHLKIQEFKAKPGSGQMEMTAQLDGLFPSNMKISGKATLPMKEMNQVFPLEGYRYEGELNMQIDATGELNKDKNAFPVTAAQLQWKAGRIQTPFSASVLDNIFIKTSIESSTGNSKDLRISIPTAKFEFNNQPFELTGNLENLQDIHYQIAAKGTLNLDSLYQLLALDDFRLGGKLEMNLDLGGRVSDIEKKRYRNLRQKGYLQAEQLHLRSIAYPAPFVFPSLRLEFNQEHAWLKNTILQYKKNKLNLEGDVQQIVGYLMNQSELKGILAVTGKHLQLDDFTAFEATTLSDSTSTAKEGSGVLLFPDGINLILKAAIDTVQFGASSLHHLAGQLQIQKGVAKLSQTTARIAGARVFLEADYQPENPYSARFSIQTRADSFDVKKAYEEISLFREMAPSAAYTKGLISMDYFLSGRINEQMDPVYPSLKGKGKLILENVEIKGLKLFNAVSKASGKDSINNPQLKAVVINSSINNNLITIERTRMRIFGFRPRVEGQVSLDGQLNLRFRLGLPPLGIIGIPMTVTGTSENPVVRVRRGKDSEELEETVDEAVNPPEQE
ncbi:MAG: hypothetical protein JNK20_15295 [Flavipsychrobacter sp.]|nr:hypothetical protein [Flavipsychrobacter sp.]